MFGKHWSSITGSSTTYWALSQPSPASVFQLCWKIFVYNQQMKIHPASDPKDLWQRYNVLLEISALAKMRATRTNMWSNNEPEFIELWQQRLYMTFYCWQLRYLSAFSDISFLETYAGDVGMSLLEQDIMQIWHTDISYRMTMTMSFAMVEKRTVWTGLCLNTNFFLADTHHVLHNIGLEYWQQALCKDPAVTWLFFWYHFLFLPPVLCWLFSWRERQLLLNSIPTCFW